MKRLLVALVPGLLVLIPSVLVATLAGRYAALGAAYEPLLNAGVLLRAFGMFASVLLVWGWLRSRGSSRVMLATALLSGPLFYGVFAAVRALDYFPPGQAAYYGVNPMFVAAVASQCAAAGLAEMVWRWRSRSRGLAAGRPVTWGTFGALAGGLTCAFFAVLYQGGVPFFYIYQRGYMFLFT